MVVLLAIAGTVAAVLFSRASDVTGELESQDVTATKIDTAAECTNHTMGQSPATPGVWDSASGKCKWTANAIGVSPPDVTQGRCLLVGGTYTKGQSGSQATCET